MNAAAGRRAGLAAGLALLAGLGAAAWGLRAGGEVGPDALLARAQAEARAGRPADASALLHRLETLRPPTPLDRVTRGQVAWALGRGDEAVAELGLVPDDDVLAPAARLMIGQIAVKRGRLREAEDAFLACIRLEPGATKPRRELVYIYNLQHRQADLDAQLHALSERGTLEFGYVLHWTKTRNVVWNPARDCDELAKCVAADPADRASRLALAEGLRRLNRLDEAAEALAPLPDSDPEARAGRVMLALERGDLERADALLAGGPEGEPALARLRGQLALKRGDGAEAARHFRVAIAADPADRAVLAGLGAALQLQGDPAAERYRAAARRHDAITPLVTQASTDAGAKDPTLPGKLGVACEAAGRPFEALAWYNLAIARDPLDREAQQGAARLRRSIAAREAGPGTGRGG